MIGSVQLDAGSETPLYRQLYESIRSDILEGRIADRHRLPATRELAGQLGLNRATVAAAYALLETDGLLDAHVGRGTFVNARPAGRPAAADALISFASSRPAEDLFPLAEFQTTCREVTAGTQALSILQLGSPTGYGPLRHYLLEEARREGLAGPDDDLLITSGCQQALDLMQRVFVPAGESVVVEDPVYHGLKNVFQRAGARLVGVPMTENGVDVERLGRVLSAERPRLLILTPNFQNPTGWTLRLEARRTALALARQAGVPVLENDIYGDLRYRGEALPTLKQLEGRDGSVLLVRSFSKIAFPGLRVGWVIGPRGMIARLTDAKQWSDLHSDQLSQAILLRFAESGRLAAHCARVRAAGLERLQVALECCAGYLPKGSDFTRPDGGMSLWVRLPEGLDAGEALPQAEREGVTYLPGKQFAVSRYEPGTLRLSFGGLTPSGIENGLRALGRVFTARLARLRTLADRVDESPAMV